MKAPALLCAALLILTVSVRGDDFKTLDGKEYKGVTVSRVEPDGITIQVHGGIEKILFANLPKVLQKKYGYDLAKEQQYKEAEANQEAAAAQKKQLEAASIAAIWQPYTDLLARYKNDIPTGEEEKYKLLKSQYETVQAVCQKYLNAGKDKQTVADWVKRTAEHSITVGMPSELVLISWGKPNSIIISPEGIEQWIYGNNQNVYILNGAVLPTM